ncbi:MAG: hypothetical protein HFJ91_02450 [Muribaculaceae bacterium]|nr:hypothetical protein [Muribaculaceae bacterium]
MSQIRYILVVFIVISLLAGCGGAVKSDTELDRAESFVDTCPDSAIAVLQAYPTDSTVPAALRARHALLLSRALYKGMYVIDSDSLIDIALSYYDATDNVVARMHGHMVKGYYLLSMDDYSAAMIEYLTALEYASILDDHFNLGMIHWFMNILYNRSGNAVEELRHARLAVKELEMNGDFSYTGECMLGLSGAEQNSGNYVEALEIARIVRDTAAVIGDSSLLVKAVKNIGYAEYGSGNTAEALECMKEYLGSEYSHPDVKDINNTMNMSLMVGDHEYAECLRETYYTTSDSVPGLALPSSYWLVKGDYRRAYEAERADNLYTDSCYNEIIVRDMANSINGFYRQKSMDAVIKATKGRIIFFILSFAVILILVACVFYIRLGVKKSQARRDALMLASKGLMDDLVATMESIAGINESSGNFIALQLKELDSLCETYFTSRTEEKSQDTIAKKVKMIVDKISTDSTFYKGMCTQLDRANNNVISRFKDQIPGLNDVDHHFFTYRTAKFSMPSLCLFLNCDQKSIYNRTYRLRRRIEESGVEDKQDFIDILSK